jgi:hypothetical protein
VWTESASVRKLNNLVFQEVLILDDKDGKTG